MKKQTIGFPKPKKRKVSKRKVLVKKLDNLVSLIVRARDKFCVVCGSTEKLGCGHVFTRKNYSTRWDLTNCFAQCWSCNYKHEFDPMPFYDWYKAKFGDWAFRELYQRWTAIRKFADWELAEWIEVYKVLLKEYDNS